jgi:hypothetical protein
MMFCAADSRHAHVVLTLYWFALLREQLLLHAVQGLSAILCPFHLG